MLSTAFPCDGYVVSWTFYRALAFGSVYVGVFRQTSETEFTLIEKTLLPEGLTGEQTYQPDPPILVRRGDFIGVFHSRNTPREVLARSADEVPDGRYQNFYVSFMDEDIQRGVPFSINNFVNSENQASFAVQADMSYLSVPGNAGTGNFIENWEKMLKFFVFRILGQLLIAIKIRKNSDSRNWL